MIKGWFREARARAELTRIRKALERIADCLEEVSRPGSPTGLISYYTDSSGPDEGVELAYTDDHYLAQLEKVDRAAEMAGTEPIEGFDDSLE